MNLKKLGKILLVALVAVMLAVSVLPASAIATKSILYGTPQIDGKLDGIWSNASDKIAIDMYFEGDLDNYATGYASVLWDKNNLYVLGYASDTTKSLKESGTAWFTDGFEIFLDEKYAHNSVKNEISQIRVNRNGSLSGMLLGVATDENGILAEYAGTKWAVAETSDGYLAELAIPWTRIKGKADKGTKIGLVFQINDDLDNDGTEKGLTVINSESIDKWQPQYFMTFTLSATKAEDPDKSDSKPSNTQSTPDDSTANNNSNAQNTGSTTSKNDDSADSRENNAATSENDDSKKNNANTPNGDSPDSNGEDATVSNGDNSTGLDDDGNSGTVEGDTDDKVSDNDNTVYADIWEVMPKSIIIAFVTVTAVIILAIIVCLVILLKPQKKKLKPVQRENTEENNAE